MQIAANMTIVSPTVARQRIVLRGMVTGDTAWGSPPPRMSWRIIFLVAFLQAVASVAFLRAVAPDGSEHTAGRKP